MIQVSEANNSGYRIPYSRPLLPDPIALLPYLHKIHRNRYYSNTGPLVIEFEERLQKLFGAPCVTASSCTSALTACLIALDLPKGSFVACPSWTFPATPASIVSAGHIPYFVDVQEDTQALTWGVTNAKAVVMVSPFGQPIKSSWEEFNRITNIPIIVDAAAGFDAFSTICKPWKIPVCISTHATKTFGTGEGGFVICTNEPFLKRVRHILNFGMDAERNIERCGINGKLSEYHAATGLAGLDEWSIKRCYWMKKKGLYGGVGEYAQSTMTVKLDVSAAHIAQKLQAMGIEAKHGLYGCHIKNAFKYYPRTNLAVTEDLMDKIIYLPLSVDMTHRDIENVKSSLRKCLEE